MSDLPHGMTPWYAAMPWSENRPLTTEERTVLTSRRRGDAKTSLVALATGLFGLLICAFWPNSSGGAFGLALAVCLGAVSAMFAWSTLKAHLALSHGNVVVYRIGPRGSINRADVVALSVVRACRHVFPRLNETVLSQRGDLLFVNGEMVSKLQIPRIGKPIFVADYQTVGETRELSKAERQEIGNRLRIFKIALWSSIPSPLFCAMMILGLFLLPREGDFEQVKRVFIFLVLAIAAISAANRVWSILTVLPKLKTGLEKGTIVDFGDGNQVLGHSGYDWAVSGDPASWRVSTVYLWDIHGLGGLPKRTQAGPVPKRSEKVA